MLCEHDREPEVMHEPLHGGQDLFGGLRVQGARRFVQDEDARVSGQDRPDGHSLLLPSAERGDRTVSGIGEPEQVQGLLHPLAHRRRRDAE